MHILIAPNAFKNSLSATEAAMAIDKGLKESNLKCTTTCFPIGDGGDGTGELLIKKLNAAVIEYFVADPLGREIKSSFGISQDHKTAIIEMASASGLKLLSSSELDPMNANTVGTGQLIREALDMGAKEIIICIGGSATVDGGCGILHILGVRFKDRDGNILQPTPSALSKLAFIDSSNLDSRIMSTNIRILCDVDNALLGKSGAAAIYGPQKGANDNEIKQLDLFLSKLCALAPKNMSGYVRTLNYNAGRVAPLKNIEEDLRAVDSGTAAGDDASSANIDVDLASIKYGGAAGGVAAGLYAFANAKLENGIESFLNLTDFDGELSRSNLIITGEGSIDEQTLQGKGPYGVALAAKRKNIPVIGLAGKVPISPSENLNKYFNLLLAIGNDTVSLEQAISNTAANLYRVAKSIGNFLSVKP